ncbi:hypothetical protein [Cupriavidus numazuensis]|uniref:Uncharacterized protein n=1 Tax=Cupriavidus numazuensis TaxID=221992 RepID=A0ABN7Q685_9BURK|nr:hypothetical protein [Cupriavidus numazuensis]CAG2158489.1 hypothetical protein LMG26411_06012 [Cupriavidus numazuensis]
MYSSNFSERVGVILRSFKGTIWILSIIFPILGYPTLLEYVNSVPKRENLRWLSGDVISVRKKSPHMTLKLSDGSIHGFDFYGNLSGLARGRPELSDEQVTNYESFLGCSARIGVSDVKWSIIEMPQRIWELDCYKKGIEYEKSARDAQWIKRAMLWVALLMNAFPIYLILRVFAFECKKWKDSENKKFRCN